MKRARCVNCGKEYGKHKNITDTSYGFCPTCLDLLIRRARAQRIYEKEGNFWAKIEVGRIDNILRWRRKEAK